MWIGQAFSLFGSRVVQFALVWWLTRSTGSATVLATASLVALIPEIALSPVAGVYVDRWNRRWIMIVSDGLIALVSVWLAILFWTDAMRIGHVYVALVVRSIGGSFHMPAMQASTSLMVPKEQLNRVNGLNQTLGGVLTVAGPPLGAILMDLMPLFGVMLVDVGTAILAILPLFFVFVPHPKRREIESAGQSIWSEMRQGLDYIRDWRGLVAIIVMAMIVKIALTPAFSLLPLVVSDHFGKGPAQLGLLEAVMGVGIIAGGVTLSTWGGFRRRISTTLLGLIPLGAGLIVLGLAPANLFSMGIIGVLTIGLAVPLVDGPIMAIMQATVAPEMQGRVFTLIGSLVWITSPFSLLVAGPVSDWVGLHVWYLAAGAACILLAFILFFIPAVIHIEDHGAVESSRPDPGAGSG